ncbi:nuclear-interacting partner of ALK isoform X2 [Cygnus olor]|uniref:nuclear-interacting partner of ALK isoform X2 n=1 Tax=Cygnus olor TaxID=8869 RepID=UPI001ADE4FC7|nr:nuclear-interacting partner of ALK isoform X2 [Cygnus olor]
MAAPSAAGARGRPPAATPQQIRDLIDGGIAPEGGGSDGKEAAGRPQPANGSLQVDAPPSESTSKEAYFSRVETFTPLKWAGKPHELSPLVCARYGWANVECDVLKCSSCRAFLCASLQLAFDFAKYKERCSELKKSLCTAHEKFCFWPDSPCPDRFALLLVDEPRALLQDFLERFQSLCQLELQLPSLRAEDMKSTSLTEEKITLLLQLIREELERNAEGEKPPVRFTSEALPVHVSACVLALCGWTCGAVSGSLLLSVITCSRCMRKVGLWGFHQLEPGGPELDSCSPSGAPTAPAERCPPVPTSPRRMLTRSQDAVPPGSEQEKSPSPVVSRPRAWDSPSPVERGEAEAASPTLRSRPVTRSMGQGEAAVDVPSSPVRRAKRARLCSSSSSDASSRSFFDPTSQHRDWCPWVNAVEGAEAPEDSAAQAREEPPKAEPGWQVILNVLLAIRKCDRVPETEPVSLSVKSSKVFRIFRQWESVNPS